MAKVSRKQYTVAIPNGAEPTTTTVTVRGKKVKDVPAMRFRGADGKMTVAPLTEDGKKIRMETDTYYGRVKGKLVSLDCTNKQAAEIKLADLIRKAERNEAGLVDPFEAHNKRPISEHIDAYRDELKARDNGHRYAKMVHTRLTSLCEGCAFEFLPDLSASKAMQWLALQRQDKPLAELPAGIEEFTRDEAAKLLGISPGNFGAAIKRWGLPATGNSNKRRFPRATVEAARERLSKGLSVQTSNHYITQLKGFCHWLVKDRRMAVSPMADLAIGNIKTDRRHDRRELTVDELRLLLNTTRASKRSFRGLNGEDRYHLYACACGTGFRADAMASLTPANFDLDATPPTVTLTVRRDKSRKGKKQPLPADVAAIMKEFIAARPKDQLIWQGSRNAIWAKHSKSAEMLRLDLREAGIPYEVAGPDGPLFADFHALRHSYITALGRSGVDLRTVQELAGHSTPVLTARYMHKNLADLASGVDRLPGFISCSNLAHESDGEGWSVMEIRDMEAFVDYMVRLSTYCKSLSCKEIDGD